MIEPSEELNMELFKRTPRTIIQTVAIVTSHGGVSDDHIVNRHSKV